jgi:hypothetical protein
LFRKSPARSRQTLIMPEVSGNGKGGPNIKDLGTIRGPLGPGRGF